MGLVSCQKLHYCIATIYPVRGGSLEKLYGVPSFGDTEMTDQKMRPEFQEETNSHVTKYVYYSIYIYYTILYYIILYCIILYYIILYYIICIYIYISVVSLIVVGPIL